MANNSDCEIVCESEGCEIVSEFNKLTRIMEKSLKTPKGARTFITCFVNFMNYYHQLSTSKEYYRLLISREMYEHLVSRVMDCYEGTGMNRKTRLDTAIETVNVFLSVFNLEISN